MLNSQWDLTGTFSVKCIICDTSMCVICSDWYWSLESYSFKVDCQNTVQVTNNLNNVKCSEASK